MDIVNGHGLPWTTSWTWKTAILVELFEILFEMSLEILFTGSRQRSYLKNIIQRYNSRWWTISTTKDIISDDPFDLLTNSTFSVDVVYYAVSLYNALVRVWCIYTVCRAIVLCLFIHISVTLTCAPLTTAPSLKCALRQNSRNEHSVYLHRPSGLERTPNWTEWSSAKLPSSDVLRPFILALRF